FVSLFLGAAVVYKSHKPDFNPRHYTPSFFYKNHLNSLKKKGLVDEEKYNKMLNNRLDRLLGDGNEGENANFLQKLKVEVSHIRDGVNWANPSLYAGSYSLYSYEQHNQFFKKKLLPFVIYVHR
ncbi:conserved Plasmodium protein, unknown function, partial [Plasmodium ovale curtisi]